MKNNKLIHFNNAIYILSKDYAFSIDLYRTTEQTDFKTGKKTVQRNKWHIKKALILPSTLFRDFSTSVLRHPEIRGVIDVTERDVLINKKQLSKDFIILKGDHFIFKHKKFEIVRLNQLELADFWHLTLKEVEGQVTYQIHDRKIRSRFKISHEFDLL